MTPETKDTNPKAAVADGKLPLHLWPTTATALGCLAFLDGALKYGRSNWRVAGVRASTYVDAAKRHLDKWFEGEENDIDSELPHLAHALACVAILVDAGAVDKLNDDRMVNGVESEYIDSLSPHVARLRDLHKDRSPKHYTIDDTSGPKVDIRDEIEDCRQMWMATHSGSEYGPIVLRLGPVMYTRLWKSCEADLCLGALIDAQGRPPTYRGMRLETDPNWACDLVEVL